jgi:hypothetical protein
MVLVFLGHTYEEGASVAARTALLCIHEGDDDVENSVTKTVNVSSSSGSILLPPPPVFFPDAMKPLVPTEALLAMRGHPLRLLLSYLVPCLDLPAGGVVDATTTPELGKDVRAQALQLSGFFLAEINPKAFLDPEQEPQEGLHAFQERRTKNRYLVAQLYEAMLRRIDDSDENIRVLACSVLLRFNDWLAVVHSRGLVAGASAPTTTTTATTSDSGGNVEGVVGVAALAVLASKLPTYQQYLEQCCLRLIVGDPSKMFKSRMEALLQGAAVIDPDEFRKSMAAFLAANEHMEPDVRHTCDQLLEHVDVVARFGAMKARKNATQASDAHNTVQATDSSSSDMVSTTVEDDNGMDSEDEIYAKDDIDED